MDKNGKMVDVLIEDNIGVDPQTGMKIIRGLIIWADAGMRDIIKNISGIHYVIDYDTCYYADLDP